MNSYHSHCLCSLKRAALFNAGLIVVDLAICHCKPCSSGTKDVASLCTLEIPGHMAEGATHVPVAPNPIRACGRGGSSGRIRAGTGTDWKQFGGGSQQQQCMSRTYPLFTQQATRLLGPIHLGPRDPLEARWPRGRK